MDKKIKRGIILIIMIAVASFIQIIKIIAQYIAN